MNESAYNHIAGENHGIYFTAEKKRINHIYKLKEKYPDRVNIRSINPDGSINVLFPDDWLKISPPKQMNWSEERKAKAREQLAQNIKNSSHCSNCKSRSNSSDPTEVVFSYE